MSQKDLPSMPLPSNYFSRKEWEAALWRKILESKNLIDLLTTSYERHNLIMRTAVMDGIASGKSYRKIGEELWISPQTVSVIKKAIKEKTYKSYAERSIKERKKRIYNSITSTRKMRRPKPLGIPRRTKYGTVYL